MRVGLILTVKKDLEQLMRKMMKMKINKILMKMRIVIIIMDNKIKKKLKIKIQKILII